MAADYQLDALEYRLILERKNIEAAAKRRTANPAPHRISKPPSLPNSASDGTVTINPTGMTQVRIWRRNPGYTPTGNRAI